MIRAMKNEDYDRIYELWLKTPCMGLNDIDDSREGIQKYLLRNPNTCYVAEKDQQIIGIILSGHDGRRGYIHHMAVQQSQQRQGIGTALLNHAMEALEAEGITKVALVVFEANVKGNVFWEKNGFITREDLVYRNKAIKKVKRIDT